MGGGLDGWVGWDRVNFSVSQSAKGKVGWEKDGKGEVCGGGEGYGGIVGRSGVLIYFYFSFLGVVRVFYRWLCWGDSRLLWEKNRSRIECDIYMRRGAVEERKGG